MHPRTRSLPDPLTGGSHTPPTQLPLAGSCSHDGQPLREGRQVANPPKHPVEGRLRFRCMSSACTHPPRCPSAHQSNSTHALVVITDRVSAPQSLSSGAQERRIVHHMLTHPPSHTLSLDSTPALPGPARPEAHLRLNRDGVEVVQLPLVGEVRLRPHAHHASAARARQVTRNGGSGYATHLPGRRQERGRTPWVQPGKAAVARRPAETAARHEVCAAAGGGDGELNSEQSLGVGSRTIVAKASSIKCYMRQCTLQKHLRSSAACNSAR